MNATEVGRNAPCPCGSGDKYKKCCLAKDESARKPHTGEDALLILQPTRGSICHETQLAIDLNIGVPARRVLRIARKPVDVARNELAAYAVQAIASGSLFDFAPRETFVLWVDDDAWFPPGLIPTMMRCLRDPAARMYDALFAWFSKRVPFSPPVAFRRIEDGDSFPKPGVDCAPGDVVPVEVGGFHCVLMRSRLLERVGPNPFTADPVREESEDWAFCRRAKAAGAHLAVATQMPVAHVDPRDGVAYLPGMPAMLMHGNALRALTLEHAYAEGAKKTPEHRIYGLEAFDAANRRLRADGEREIRDFAQRREVQREGAQA